VKESILTTGGRHVSEVRDINRSLAEKALNMRCQAYLSQVKANLLTATIYGINNSKKSLQRELDQKTRLERELKVANATKDRLLSILAHDLRSPFTNLIGIAEGLSKNLQPPNLESLGEHIGMVHSVALSGVELVDNLLTWIWGLSGQIKPQPVRFEANKLVQELFMLFESHAKNKSISLKCEMPAGSEIQADRHMTQTILRNLISNGIKYTANGEVLVKLEERNREWVFWVIDTGVGIAPEVLDRLFKNQLVESATGTAKEYGTGLGLFLAKELCESQSGKIWVTSKPGQGSQFAFSLPKVY